MLNITIKTILRLLGFTVMVNTCRYRLMLIEEKKPQISVDL